MGSLQAIEECPSHNGGVMQWEKDENEAIETNETDETDEAEDATVSQGQEEAA